MNKIYNEPEFKVIVTNSADVITTSGGETTPTYNSGPFETGNEPFVGA